jgi:hypothetical protein
MFPSLILGFSGGKYKPFFRNCKVEIAKLWFRLASLSFASLCQNGIPDRWQGRYFQWQATSEKTQPFQSGNCDFACLLQCLLANINIVFCFR